MQGLGVVGLRARVLGFKVQGLKGCWGRFKALGFRVQAAGLASTAQSKFETSCFTGNKLNTWNSSGLCPSGRA